MYLNKPTHTPSTRYSVTEFYGLDSHVSAPPGWFFRDCNVTSDEAPALTVRRPRQQVEGATFAAKVVIIEDILCGVGPGQITFQNLKGGESVPPFSLDSSYTQERLLVPCSYYLLVWPDRAYINVLDANDRGFMGEETALFGNAAVHIDVCNKSGKSATVVSDTAPADGYVGANGQQLLTSDGDLWLWTKTPVDGGEEAPRLFLCHANEVVGDDDSTYIEKNWELVEPYIRLSMAPPYHDGGPDYGWLQEGEVVEIRLKDSYGAVLSATPNAFNYNLDPILGAHVIEQIVNARAGDETNGDHRTASFLFPGIVDFTGVDTLGGNGVKLYARRVVPDLDCAVALDGRVYGAFRGVSSISGEEVNEIYISAADDFKRFFRTEDTGADPITLSVVEPGAFHAAAVVGGVVTFWKDRRIVTVGGSGPANFYLSEQDGRRPWFKDTLCMIDGYAYYLDTGGNVLAYYGGHTTCVSERLGSRLRDVRSAIGGSTGGKYYLAVEHKSGERFIYVYDTASGIWHTESQPSPFPVVGMAEGTGGLYLETGTRLLLVGEGGETAGTTVPDEERDIEWSWETGMIGLDTPKKKYISKVGVRLSMEEGAQVTMWAEYDSHPERHLVWQAEADRTRVVSSYMAPRRCDHFRLILKGRGNVTLLGLFYDVREVAR